MPEFGFSLTRVFPYEDGSIDFTCRTKPMFWHVLRSEQSIDLQNKSLEWSHIIETLDSIGWKTIYINKQEQHYVEKSNLYIYLWCKILVLIILNQKAKIKIMQVLV